MRFGPPRHFRSLLALPLVLGLVVIACQDPEEQKAELRASAAQHVENERWPEAIIDYRKLLEIDPNDADAHFQLAQAYVSSDKPKEGLWQFSEAVRLDPSNLEARVGVGTLAMLGRDFEETLSQAEAILAADPDQVSALLLRGQAAEGLGRPEEAEASYLRAVEIGEEKGPFFFILGSYYQRRGDREKAEPALVRFSELEPSLQSYSVLGRFLAEDPTRDEETVAAYRRGIEVATDEEMVAAYENLALFRYAREQYELGSTELEGWIAGIDEHPRRRANLIYILARFYVELEREEDLDRIMEQAAAESTDDPKPYLILADYRSIDGDLEGAVEAVDQALARDPGNVNVTLRKAELKIDIGYKRGNPTSVGEGMAIADEVLVSEPTNPTALYLKGKGAIALEEYEEAIRFLRASIDSRPDWNQSHLALGNALAQTGSVGAARAEVARAVELAPGVPEPRKQLAQLHAALGEHEYAVEQGQTYLQWRPGDAEVRLLVAQSLAALGRSEDALSQVGDLGERADEAQAHFAKGRLQLASGDFEGARAELRKANALRPHHPTILTALLSAEQRLGNLRAMGPLLEAANREKPDEAALTRLRGVYALRTGDARTAEEMFGRSIEQDPTDVESYRRLAQIYQGTGRFDEAGKLYDRAIERRPDSARLHHERAMFDQGQGRRAPAVAGYRRAIEIDGGLSEAKNNLAYLLAERGEDLDLALDLAQEAKAAMPDNPSAADTLGFVLYKRGIPSAAVGYLREAVAGMDAGSPELGVVRHHLALAYEANDQKDLAIESLEISLSELEAREAAAKRAGTRIPEPEWAGDAREMLMRLKSAS